MKLAIIGCTGLVGSVILKVLDEFSVKISNLTLVASPKSIGKKIAFRNKYLTIVSIEQAVKEKPDIVIFSAGSLFLKNGHQSFQNLGQGYRQFFFWRMKKNIPL